MSRCNHCGYVFRTPVGEEQDHDCPRCGWYPAVRIDHCDYGIDDDDEDVRIGLKEEDDDE